MRCVNDTLPPRPRRRWLLMTTRLSISSFAGMTRTLVAVGTASEASMFATTRAAAPLRGLLASVVGFGGSSLTASAFLASCFFGSALVAAGFDAASGVLVGAASAGAEPFVVVA